MYSMTGLMTTPGRVGTVVSGNLLPLEEFSWWFDAICRNDTDTVSEALKGKETHRLLNGLFTSPIKEPGVFIECPASVAVCHGAFDVLSIMKTDTDCLNFSNSKGDNVIHDLIALSCKNPDDEESCVDCYEKLCFVLSTEQMKSLLFTTSAKLLPLEMACFQGTMKMVHVILETRGIYLLREELLGLTLTKWYDCDDYETLTGRQGRRIYVHPLYILSRMSKKDVHHPYTGKILFSDPIRTWSRALGRSSLLLVIVWFLVRFSCYACFTMFDSAVGDLMQKTSLLKAKINQTADCFPDQQTITRRDILYTFMGFSMFCCAVTILFDLGEGFSSLYMTHKIKVRNSGWIMKTASNVILFRIGYFLMSLTMLSGLVLIYISEEYLLNDTTTQTRMEISNTCRLITSILVIWSMMYFMQLLPGIGIFVISIQHMLKDLMSFLLLYCFLLFQFTHAFMVFIKSSSKVPCYVEFKSYTDSFYTMFSAMLNMIDFNSYDVGANKPLLVTMHVGFVFLIAILMINFLIGLFSNAVALVYSNRDIFIELERMATWQAVHARISLFCPPLSKCLMKLSKYRFEEVDGRVCIKCVETIDKVRSSQRK